MASAYMRIEGADKIERKLLAMPKRVAKKVIRKAVREGGKPILKDMKSNVKSMLGRSGMKTFTYQTGKKNVKLHTVGVRGLLLKYLALRKWRRQRPLAFGMGVYISPEANEFFAGVSAQGQRYYIPAAIEYGHGNVAAIPFMRTAVDKNKGRSVAIMKKAIAAGIEREASKPA